MDSRIPPPEDVPIITGCRKRFDDTRATISERLQKLAQLNKSSDVCITGRSGKEQVVLGSASALLARLQRPDEFKLTDDLEIIDPNSTSLTIGLLNFPRMGYTGETISRTLDHDNLKARGKYEEKDTTKIGINSCRTINTGPMPPNLVDAPYLPQEDKSAMEILTLFATLSEYREEMIQLLWLHVNVERVFRFLETDPKSRENLSGISKSVQEVLSALRDVLRVWKKTPEDMKASPDIWSDAIEELRERVGISLPARSPYTRRRNNETGALAWQVNASTQTVIRKRSTASSAELEKVWGSVARAIIDGKRTDLQYKLGVTLPSKLEDPHQTLFGVDKFAHAFISEALREGVEPNYESIVPLDPYGNRVTVDRPGRGPSQLNVYEMQMLLGSSTWNGALVVVESVPRASSSTYYYNPQRIQMVLPGSFIYGIVNGTGKPPNPLLPPLLFLPTTDLAGMIRNRVGTSVNSNQEKRRRAMDDLDVDYGSEEPPEKRVQIDDQVSEGFSGMSG